MHADNQVHIKIAATAFMSVTTVRKYFLGTRVQTSSRLRIEKAAKELGLKLQHPPSAVPAIRSRDARAASKGATGRNQ